MSRVWHLYLNYTRNPSMATVAPFHSIAPAYGTGLLGMARAVHHNNTDCTEGNNIEPQYLAPGTGGRPLCAHCARLSGVGGMFR